VGGRVGVGDVVAVGEAIVFGTLVAVASAVALGIAVMLGMGVSPDDGSVGVGNKVTSNRLRSSVGSTVDAGKVT
jgi:hypothetical protein